jgi:hypothetical protein
MERNRKTYCKTAETAERIEYFIGGRNKRISLYTCSCVLFCTAVVLVPGVFDKSSQEPIIIIMNMFNYHTCSHGQVPANMYE